MKTVEELEYERCEVRNKIEELRKLERRIDEEIDATHLLTRPACYANELLTPEFHLALAEALVWFQKSEQPNKEAAISQFGISRQFGQVRAQLGSPMPVLNLALPWPIGRNHCHLFRWREDEISKVVAAVKTLVAVPDHWQGGNWVSLGLGCKAGPGCQMLYENYSKDVFGPSRSHLAVLPEGWR